jgi:hypothetical protein
MSAGGLAGVFPAEADYVACSELESGISRFLILHSANRGSIPQGSNRITAQSVLPFTIVLRDGKLSLKNSTAKGGRRIIQLPTLL